jgi:hypothetical protein
MCIGVSIYIPQDLTNVSQGHLNLTAEFNLLLASPR